MNERLKELYKKHILIKAKDEQHVGELEDYTHLLEAYNPMCGDKYTLYLKIADDRIEDAAFKGFGCAISKASTAVLTARLIGTSLTEAGKLTSLFLELINPDSKAAVETITADEELQAFAGTREYPERQQCASLAWTELSKSGFLA
jgi:nitrogen fixation NifU-like protein